jgi:phosphonate transport system ATP-binding protein
MECHMTKPQVTAQSLGLSREGKRWLFRQMSWTLPRRQFIALTGPSGAGKSSLLRLLCGLESPTEGEIHFRCNAGCLHDPSRFQKKVGVVFQNLRLTGNASLLQNVLCGRLGRYAWWQTILGFPKPDVREAEALLTTLGLKHLTHRWVAEVSGGEQQRTALARALFQEPELLLADEPISQLDPTLTHQILAHLKKYALDNNATVICVLHDPALVERYADQVLNLNPNTPGNWTLRPGNIPTLLA